MAKKHVTNFKIAILYRFFRFNREKTMNDKNMDANILLKLDIPKPIINAANKMNEIVAFLLLDSKYSLLYCKKSMRANIDVTA
jgi:hypothetical protein